MSKKEEFIIFRPTYSQEHVDLSKKYLGALKNKIKDTQKVTLKETKNVAVIVEPRKHEDVRDDSKECNVFSRRRLEFAYIWRKFK